MRARIISLFLVLVAFLLLAPAASPVFACMPEPDSDSGCARWRTNLQPTHPSAPGPLAVNAAATPKGDSPDTARPIDDAWQTIDPGANIWFKTDYSDGYRIIELWVDSNAPNGIGLSVFSPDQYLDGLGVNSKPIGRGSFNKGQPYHALTYRAGYAKGGVWYALVTNFTSSPISFKLGGNVNSTDTKKCHGYWEYLPSGQYIYWIDCNPLRNP